MSIFSEAWSDTRRDARRGARRWLRRHPATNLTAWGLTTLTYSLPRRAIVASHRAAYRPRVSTTGRPAVTTAPATEPTTVAATASTRSGHVLTGKTATTAPTGAVVHMSTTSRLLGTGQLARTYASIIDQVGAWAPMKNEAATSIVDATTDLKITLSDVVLGMEDLHMTLVLGRIDQRVRTHLTYAGEMLSAAQERIESAGRYMNEIYVDQINQEASGVPMAGAAITGGHYPPLQTRDLARTLMLLIGEYLPESDQVITGLWAHLNTNKHAMSLWGRALENLAGKISAYGVHQRVCDQVGLSSDYLRTAGSALHATQLTLNRLYRSQGDAERAGATVTPISQ